MKIIAGMLCALALAGSARAADEPPGPCKQIAEACKSAGFTKGDWKKGDGLWKDCVDPIIQGKAQPAGASKPLPTVDPNVVAECKAKHPKFGEGKKGVAK
ncbi:MAG TPA: hypothetical protein VLW85_17135 [Myxococcales bacterium]|nr:hypothetical protein [Myxococcales bacterium]